MYLKSITLRGFKSFARKTHLEFEPGITVIVGPNGSGKSNIADAVMWVLGEQSPTSLRGTRMEDVIFSGSEKSKPRGMAEVVLTLDNSNKDFPLDFSEVTISRNVLRGSESEYRLNNVTCRLLDIQELLSDAGVGRTLNAVITQGNLDEVLICRPDERRSYIEEAGGLLKYRRRREKALRKLERMEEELTRLNDILREVKRQLAPLDRQASRLEEYQKLMRELSESRARLDVAHLRAIHRDWKEYELNQERRRKEIEELGKKIHEKLELATKLEEIEEKWRKDESSLRDKLYRLVSVHEQLKALALGRLSSFSSTHERDDYLEKLKKQMREREELDLSLNKTFAEIRRRIESLEVNISLLDERKRNATHELARLEALRELLTKKDRQPVVEKAVNEQMGELLSEQKRLEEISKRSEVCNSEIKAKIQALENELIELGEKRKVANTKLISLEKEKAMLATRLEALWQLDEGKWTVENATEALLSSDPTGGELSKPLIFSLEIEPKYEKAILSFIGPWAFGIACRDELAIRRAIEFLKERELGQSLFFLSGGGTGGSTRENLLIDGCLYARDLVNAPMEFSSALDVLLEDVYVAPNLDTAFGYASKYPGKVFLTPDGDVISSGTLLKGGSAKVSRAHIERISSRRRSYEEKLEECLEELDRISLVIDDLERKELSIRKDLEEERKKMEEASKEAMGASLELEACRAKIKAISFMGSVPQENYGPLEMDDSCFDIDLLSSKIEEAKKLETDADYELMIVRKELEEALAQARVLEEKISSNKREIEGLIKKEEELKRFTWHGEHKGYEVSDDFKRLENVTRRLIEIAFIEREKTLRILREGDSKAEEASQQLKIVRSEIEELERNFEDVRNELHSEEVSSAPMKVKLSELSAKITGEHGIPLEFALKHYPDSEPTEELTEKVRQLEAKLERIGPVNPDAIVERQELAGRFEFLKGQIEDIEESRVKLRKVIREIDKQIERRFMETINEVNGHFQEIFSFLFRGGKAEVRLTEPEDPLNSGVEIYAEPEGKRLKRISLLSGGEMALIAIAFFFALFRVRPSPFYFLDEVEAALDDVNLNRFLELVKEFRKESQLILITHQKRSMEIADVLYGVTMQEDGISKVISQRLADRVA